MPLAPRDIDVERSPGRLDADRDPAVELVVERGGTHIEPPRTQRHLELRLLQAFARLRAVHHRRRTAWPDAGGDEPDAEGDQQDRPEHVPIDVAEDPEVG